MRIGNKCFATVVLAIAALALPAQVKRFSASSRIKPEPNYDFKAYGFADLKSAGAGIQYQDNGYLSLDASVYYRYGAGFHTIYNIYDDYSFLHGAGIMLFPRFSPDRMNVINIGPTFSAELVSHGKVWYEKSEYEYVNQAVHGNICTLGAYIGFKFMPDKTLIEPYLSMGVAHVAVRGTEYGSSLGDHGAGKPYHPDAAYPVQKTVYRHEQYVYGNVGIKVGLGFHQNKNMTLAIHQFDAVYNPALQSLRDTIEARKNLHQLTVRSYKKWRRSYDRYVNTRVYYDYKRTGQDSALFYKTVNQKLQELRSLMNLNTGSPNQYDEQYEKKRRR